ncbi:MAG: hypothetical protein QNJ68_03510 [Microcoleaceae cyanobacterium MO_207.B10]|nr:hypothetical protein [Microcoleaceae cyanobacterium MO_207.B10]
MTPEEQQYIQNNKPERFFRVQIDLPPVAAFNIPEILVEVCHMGRYTGMINSDGRPNLDTSDIPLGTVIGLGSLSEIASKSGNPEEFNAVCNLLFSEINSQATALIKQRRLENSSSDLSNET